MRLIKRDQIKPGMTIRALMGKFAIEGEVESYVRPSGQIVFIMSENLRHALILTDDYNVFVIQDVEPTAEGTLVKATHNDYPDPVYAIRLFDDNETMDHWIGVNMQAMARVFDWSEFIDVEVIGGLWGSQVTVSIAPEGTQPNEPGWKLVGKGFL